MKKPLKILGLTLAAIAAIAVIAYAAASWATANRYNRQWTAHDATFPIPFPLDDADLEALRAERIAAGAPADDPLAGLDLAALALQSAIARGQHLIESRVGCAYCHRPDFGGGAVIDEPMVGRWIAPNLTAGRGGVTAGYTAADWDHAVRHGLRRDGRTSSMPSIDFVNLSDRELSDIAAYIQSLPPVDRKPGQVEFGPILKVMLAFGAGPPFVAFDIDHMKPHAAHTPEPAPTVDYGAHVVQVCRGCHGPTLSGGKLKGDPHMPIVANLTPHESGLKHWGEADFLLAMREGRRPDGRILSEFMPWRAYAQMSEAELKALWAYLQTLEPIAKGNR
ncbi:MAG: cytochrome c [Steroidobacteraceae bacterium]